jgi:hypothetical protein
MYMSGCWCYSSFRRKKTTFVNVLGLSLRVNLSVTVGKLDCMSRGLPKLGRSIPKYGIMGKTGVRTHGPRTAYQRNTAYIPIYKQNQYDFHL